MATTAEIQEYTNQAHRFADAGLMLCSSANDFSQVYQRAMFFEMACRIIIQTSGEYSVLSSKEIDDLESYIKSPTSPPPPLATGEAY